MEDIADFIDSDGSVIENSQELNVSLVPGAASHATLPGQQITNIEIPSQPQWCLIPLYSQSQTKDVTGAAKIRFWQVGFDGVSKLYTISGYIDSDKPIITERDVVPKSTRNMQEQALQEARQKYIIKYRAGSKPLGDIPNDIEPQLSVKYVPPETYDDNNKKKPENCKKFPVVVQAKIDGARALIFLEQGKVIIGSRGGNQFSYLDHIRAEMLELFAFLPPGTVIDSEIYRHGWPIEKILSVLKTVKFKHEHNELLKAYIFDIILPYPAPTEVRFKTLIEALQAYYADGKVNNTFEVLTPIIAYSHQDLSDMHQYFTTKLGFEGLMIRHIAGTNTSGKDYERSLYKGKRNQNLLKMKSWIYDEGIIVGVKEGTGREKGLAIFEVNYKGDVFTVRPQEEFVYREYWYKNPYLVIGLEYTIKYFEKTEKGVPRFPIGVAFRLNV